ncbi:hypothetical protein HOLleu_42148 [Holothuria leucospilota]|uniref:DNA-directed DNA polymerase n=1 Tax=Holothuria leucospilota TaxID=206669 RepID=A0A9Q1BA99_HOLLE|nr:hypothetical protein HOLleu_42148 [Holothuria leucospilota]
MACDLCIMKPFESESLVCEDKQVIFQGPNTKREFCEWLLAPRRNNSTCIAHNLKGFDGYFILQHLYDNGVVPEIITNGAKLKKGYFPHLFNTTENQTYMGHFPEASYYAPDVMSSEKRKEFFEWYETEKNKGLLFDFQKELVAYCISDVDILRRCCLKFRSLFMDITCKEIDNDVEDEKDEGCITIASACNLVFRRNYMKPNSIAVFTNDKPKSYSYAALEWLYYESKQRGVYIEHAQNEGEEKIGNYRVDGFARLLGSAT